MCVATSDKSTWARLKYGDSFYSCAMMKFHSPLTHEITNNIHLISPLLLLLYKNTSVHVQVFTVT